NLRRASTIKLSNFNSDFTRSKASSLHPPYGIRTSVAQKPLLLPALVISRVPAKHFTLRCAPSSETSTTTSRLFPDTLNLASSSQPMAPLISAPISAYAFINPFELNGSSSSSSLAISKLLPVLGEYQSLVDEVQVKDSLPLSPQSKAELKYIEPHFKAGKYYIECSDEELKVGCNKWKNSLVGCFLSGG
ncbi:hypothetical protein MKX01_040202, partial [Papaver californicum]